MHCHDHHDLGCLANDRGRYAIITSLRSNSYLPLVQLSPHVEAVVRNISELRYWNDLYFPSQRQDGRFSLNWVKLRAWELEEFDAVLLVDSDLTVLGDLSHIFTLPTAFAAVPDQDPVAPAWWFGSLGKIQGGMLFIRPCRAVAQHMISMLQHDRLLHFEYEYAEQDFLDWYFKFDRWLLPLEYNSVLPISVGNKTQGGMVAKAIHFTKHKPYVRNPSVPQHWYLTCTPMPAISGDVVADEDDAIKAYRGRRYGGDFGGVLGTGDAPHVVPAEVLPVAPLQHSRPPVEHVEEVALAVVAKEGSAAQHAAAPQYGPAAVTGTVRVQVTIPAQTPSAVNNNATALLVEDEGLLRQRVL